MSALVDIQNFSTEMNKMKQEMTEKLKAMFQPAFQEFFAQNPDVKWVSWYQYTPYFNDGEPCEFGVHEKSISLQEEMPTAHLYDEDGWYSLDNLPREDRRQWYTDQLAEGRYSDHYKKQLELLNDPNMKPILKALEDLKAFDNIDESVYQALGEGQVIVSRAGIVIEEYDHD